MDGLRNIKTYITYKQLFFEEYNKEKFKARLAKIDSVQLLNIIIELSLIEGKAKKQIQDEFIEWVLSAREQHVYHDGVCEHIREVYGEGVLYSQQSLYMLSKWIFAYGNFNMSEAVIESKKAVFEVIYYCLILADYFDAKAEDEVHLNYEFLRNAQFNKRCDIGAALVRTAFVFGNFARKKSIFGKKTEYLDLYNDFLQFNHYTVYSYIGLMFSLFTLFANEFNTINPQKIVNIFDSFKKLKIKNVMIKELDERSITIVEMKRWAQRTISIDWNFSMYWQRPFVQVATNYIIPVLPQVLFENFFLTMKIKMSKVYSGKEREQFNTFFGALFEKYAQLIIRLALRKKKINYCFYREKMFGDKRTPDAMIRYKNKLLVVEVKAKSIRKESYFFGNDEKLQKDISRLIIEPISQMELCVNAMMSSKSPPYDLSGVEHIYYMTVNLGGMEMNYLLKKFVNEKINNNRPNYLKWFVLDIEEFEVFCQLLERRNNVFTVLDKIFSLDYSFQNFMHYNNYYPKRFKAMDKIFYKEKEKILDSIRP